MSNDIQQDLAEERSLSKERHERCAPIVKEILQICRKHDVKENELNYIWQLLLTSINEAMEDAQEILWGKDSREITINDIEDVLKKDSKDVEQVADDKMDEVGKEY